MASPEIIAAKAFSTDSEVLEILREIGEGDDQPEVVALNSGGEPVPPSFHLPDYAVHNSQVIRALARIVQRQAEKIAGLEERLADVEAGD